MKKMALFAGIAGVLFFPTACNKRAPESTEGVAPQAAAPAAVETKPEKNLERPKSPLVKTMTVYKTSPENLTGTISSKETYNEKGLLVELVSYDYYGSGEIDQTTTFAYDDQGRMIKRSDGVTTTTYTYDENGKIKLEAWSRAGEGAHEENLYNDKGDLIETKYFTKEGKHDYSRTHELVYNDKGRIAEDKKWEKYTDGSDPLLQYNFKNQYDARGNLVQQVNINEDGSIHIDKRMKFDNRGNEIETLEFERGSETPNSREASTFNEYGEMIRNESFSCSDTGDCGDPWSVSITEYDQYGHKLKYMLTQDAGENFGERREYVYSETP